MVSWSDLQASSSPLSPAFAGQCPVVNAAVQVSRVLRLCPDMLQGRIPCINFGPHKIPIPATSTRWFSQRQFDSKELLDLSSTCFCFILFPLFLILRVDEDSLFQDSKLQEVQVFPSPGQLRTAGVFFLFRDLWNNRRSVAVQGRNRQVVVAMTSHCMEVS